MSGLDAPSIQGRPTLEAYNELQLAYDHYNAALFDGQLPQCLITMQRQANCMGYFSRKRFVRSDGQTTDEIALNPEMLASNPITETLQTLVHEMVHLWQYHYGKPGRRGYHNREWGLKMEAIGLMPSSTGKPGGAKTGERMADYPIIGGPFLEATRKLLTSDFRISWHDRYPARRAVQMQQDPETQQMVAAIEMELGAPIQSDMDAVKQVQLAVAQEDPPRPRVSTRSKYRCPGNCKQQLWGKPNLKVICGLCSQAFDEVPELGGQESSAPK